MYKNKKHKPFVFLLLFSLNLNSFPFFNLSVSLFQERSKQKIYPLIYEFNYFRNSIKDLNDDSLQYSLEEEAIVFDKYKKIKEKTINNNKKIMYISGVVSLVSLLSYHRFCRNISNSLIKNGYSFIDRLEEINKINKENFIKNNVFSLKIKEFLLKKNELSSKNLKNKAIEVIKENLSKKNKAEFENKYPFYKIKFIIPSLGIYFGSYSVINSYLIMNSYKESSEKIFEKKNLDLEFQTKINHKVENLKCESNADFNFKKKRNYKNLIKIIQKEENLEAWLGIKTNATDMFFRSSAILLFFKVLITKNKDLFLLDDVTNLELRLINLINKKKEYFEKMIKKINYPKKLILYPSIIFAELIYKFILSNFNDINLLKEEDKEEIINGTQKTINFIANIDNKINIENIESFFTIKNYEIPKKNLFNINNNIISKNKVTYFPILEKIAILNKRNLEIITLYKQKEE